MKEEIHLIIPGIIFLLIIGGGLIFLLRELVQKQVDEQVKQFADKAKIPESLRSYIKVRIKLK